MGGWARSLSEFCYFGIGSNLLYTTDRALVGGLRD